MGITANDLRGNELGKKVSDSSTNEFHIKLGATYQLRDIVGVHRHLYGDDSTRTNARATRSSISEMRFGDSVSVTMFHANSLVSFEERSGECRAGSITFVTS